MGEVMDKMRMSWSSWSWVLDKWEHITVAAAFVYVWFFFSYKRKRKRQKYWDWDKNLTNLKFLSSWCLRQSLLETLEKSWAELSVSLGVLIKYMNRKPPEIMT